MGWKPCAIHTDNLSEQRGQDVCDAAASTMFIFLHKRFKPFELCRVPARHGADSRPPLVFYVNHSGSPMSGGPGFESGSDIPQV